MEQKIKVTVGALMIAPDEHVLLVKTHKWKNLYGIPGGKIEWGETMEEALRRELREETGLEVSDIRFLLLQESINSPEFYRPAHMLLLNFSARTLSHDVTLNAEAESFSWVMPQEALNFTLNSPTRTLLETYLKTSRLEGAHGAR